MRLVRRLTTVSLVASVVSCKDSTPPAVIAITGAVSIAPSTPLAFASLMAASAPNASSSRSPVARVYDRQAVSRALTQSRSATRRLIVRFDGTAAGASVSARSVTGAAAMDRSFSTMRSALVPLQNNRVVTRTELSPAILTTRLSLAADVNVDDALAAVQALPGVASVEVDEIVPMLAPYRATPAQLDGRNGAKSSGASASAILGTLPAEQILWPTMWHYNMIEAPRAWSTQTGSANVIVAVVDNGIRFDHPALAACASFSSCSSGNLTTDGYNFVTGGARLDTAEPVCQGGTTTITEAGPGPDPTAPDDLDFTGSCWFRSTVGNHGLHVAGTIGARGNDNVGIAGVNWTVRIRPVRVLDMTGSGSFFDIAQGVLYAAGLPASDGQGGTVTAPSRAPIINMSLGGTGNSATLAAAVTAATNAGSLIIASSGNSESSSPHYPASYSEVVAVSAVGPDMQLASYSNISGNVSLSAPGGNFRSSGSAGVASTTWNFVASTPSYAYYEGTSMAAPHVSGVAALVLAANPTFTNAQLRERLQATATHVGSPGRDDRWGYGIVNAYNAVNNITAPVRKTYVHIVSATTGDTVKRVEAGATGGFSATGLTAGTYWVTAGQDDAGDGKIGRPGRRYGWFGPPGAPTPVVVSETESANVAILAGTPVEGKPNTTSATANRIIVDGWVLGQLNATYTSAWFVVEIPRAASYIFMADAVIGACSYGIELDGVLTLFASDGTTQVAENDDLDEAGGNYCPRIIRAMTPGRYYLRVTARPGTGFGQFALHVRDAT